MVVCQLKLTNPGECGGENVTLSVVAKHNMAFRKISCVPVTMPDQD